MSDLIRPDFEHPQVERLDIRLPEEIEEEVAQVIFRQIDDAVKGAQDRNQLLVEYDDQIEGLSNPTSPARWQNASDIDSPLTREGCLTIETQIIAAIRREPKVVVEADAPEDDDSASAQEALLTAKGAQIGLDATLASIAHYAIKYPCGIAFCDWTKKSHKNRYPVLYEERGGERTYTFPEHADPAKDYQTQWFMEDEVEFEGPEVRAVGLYDFFLYPSDARSIEKAHGVGERMMLSANDLIKGIEDYGYDREAVMRIIGQGSSRYDADPNDKRGADDSRVGVNRIVESTEDAFECYLWYTKLPVLLDADGELLTPEELLGDDFLCICCPQAQEVLRMSLYRRERPYIRFCVLPEPDRFYGVAIPQLLNALQTESNANLRYFIDSLNVSMAPCIKAKKHVAEDNENFRVFPGAVFWVNQMDDMEPLQWIPPSHDVMAVQQYLENWARELYSAGGYGTMPQKQRRNAEIQSVQLAAASKFDMILFYFQQGLQELAARIIALYMENLSEEGVEFSDEESHRKRVTPSMLRGRYSYRAIGTSQAADPQVRLEHALQKRAVASEYNQLTVQGLPPAILKREWHAARAVLTDLGEHNPESYLGAEPEENPLSMLGMGMGQMMPGGTPPGPASPTPGGAPPGMVPAQGAVGARRA